MSRKRKHLRLVVPLKAVQQQDGPTLEQCIAICKLFNALHSARAKDPLYVARRLVTNQHLPFMHRWAWALNQTGLPAETLSRALKDGGMSS